MSVERMEEQKVAAELVKRNVADTKSRGLLKSYRGTQQARSTPPPSSSPRLASASAASGHNA